MKARGRRFFRWLGRKLWRNRGDILRTAAGVAGDPQRADRLDRAADVLDPPEAGRLPSRFPFRFGGKS